VDLIDVDLHRPELLLSSRTDNLDSRCARVNAGSGLFKIDLECMRDSVRVNSAVGSSSRYLPSQPIEPFLTCQGDMINAQALSSAYLLDYRFIASCWASRGLGQIAAKRLRE